MKFLFDHDVPDDLSYLLRPLGHEVSLLRERLWQDAPDSRVLQHAHENGFILVTCNRDDFVELARRKPHHGIVVSRPFDKPISGKIAVKVINHYGDEVLKVFDI